MAALALAGSVNATPVSMEITLAATQGNQFGVSAPASFTGSFSVDSSFLAGADGNYGGSAVTDFLLQIGSQLFDQNTASGPDIQGILLADHKVIGLAMNFTQSAQGLRGPFLQMSTDGTWFAGSTVLQDGNLILQGGRGSQSFAEAGNNGVPEPGSFALAGLGLASLLASRARRKPAQPAAGDEHIHHAQVIC
jgi:hypothetical protein